MAAVRTDRCSVFKRLGCQNRIFKPTVNVNAVVCKYWLQGRCVRNPCRFMHPPLPIKSKSWKNPDTYKKILTNNKDKDKDKDKDDDVDCPKVVVDDPVGDQTKVDETTKQVVNDESPSNCTKQVEVVNDQNQVKNTEDHKKKKNLQTGLSILALLEGHTMGVTGIVCRSSKLYSASMDKSLRIWDCNTGHCDAVFPFDTHCGLFCLVQVGSSWMFAGLHNQITSWNFITQTHGTIRAYGGQVHAIAMSQDTDTLFAGMEDGSILSWSKSTSDSSTFSPEPTAVLKGHTGSVLSLLVIGQMLYSGSSDHSIRAWTVDTLECHYVLNGHTGAVTALLCCDRYLFTGSLDKTIKVWGHAGNGNIEQVYTHNVDDGVLAFRGMQDAENNPMLICLCRHSGVLMYYLPSFVEIGRIVSTHHIQAIELGPKGLFFTGHAQGVVSVWRVETKC